MKYKLHNNSQMLGYGYIHENYRLKGLFPSLIVEALNDGKMRTYVDIGYLNVNSIKSHERIGFQEIGKIYAFKIMFLPSFFIVKQNSGKKRILMRKKQIGVNWYVEF